MINDASVSSVNQVISNLGLSMMKTARTVRTLEIQVPSVGGVDSVVGEMAWLTATDGEVTRVREGAL